jgi:hypothetical protein
MLASVAGGQSKRRVDQGDLIRLRCQRSADLRAPGFLSAQVFETHHLLRHFRALSDVLTERAIAAIGGSILIPGSVCGAGVTIGRCRYLCRMRMEMIDAYTIFRLCSGSAVTTDAHGIDHAAKIDWSERARRMRLQSRIADAIDRCGWDRRVWLGRG